MDDDGYVYAREAVRGTKCLGCLAHYYRLCFCIYLHLCHVGSEFTIYNYRFQGLFRNNIEAASRRFAPRIQSLFLLDVTFIISALR